MGWPIFTNVSAGLDLGLTKPSFGLTDFFQCFCWAGLGLGLGWAIFSNVSGGLDLGLTKPSFGQTHFFPCFLLGWTWARFGLTPFFQCFSWARFGLDRAHFWANPFYQCVCLFGLGLWWLLCCAHVLRMTLCAAVSELRLRRLGPLTTNVIVGMIEVGALSLKQLKKTPYDLQLLFW